MGIVDQMSAVLCQLGAEVGAVEAGEPERSGGNGGVGAADHLEFEVGDDAGERNGRMGEEGAVAEAADLFRAEEGEDDGAARATAGGEDVGEGEDGGGSGGVVVGAVVDGVAVDGGADAEMVEVRGEQDDLVGRRGAAKDGDGVPGLVAGRVFELREALLKALAGSGLGSGVFWRKVPLSPPGSSPRDWNCEAAKRAAMCSSRVAEPRPWSSSSARKAMSARTSR